MGSGLFHGHGMPGGVQLYRHPYYTLLRLYLQHFLPQGGPGPSPSSSRGGLGAASPQGIGQGGALPLSGQIGWASAASPGGESHQCLTEGKGGVVRWWRQESCSPLSSPSTHTPPPFLSCRWPLLLWPGSPECPRGVLAHSHHRARPL